MNKKIGMAGSAINAITVLAFAVFMLINFNFGSYFVCIFLSLSFVMMISAFAGREFVMNAYREAVENRYRFYSYGDSMLIL